MWRRGKAGDAPGGGLRCGEEVRRVWPLLRDCRPASAWSGPRPPPRTLHPRPHTLGDTTPAPPHPPHPRPLASTHGLVSPDRLAKPLLPSDWSVSPELRPPPPCTNQRERWAGRGARSGLPARQVRPTVATSLGSLRHATKIASQV